MTREETLELLRASGLENIATVLDQTWPHSVLVARAQSRAQPAGPAAGATREKADPAAVVTRR